MRNYAAFFVLNLLCFLSCAALAFAAPPLVRYQGQAVNSQEVPLEGPYDLTFRLYPVATMGTAVWTETQAGVPLTHGLFSVLLGQVTSLAAVDWSQPLWLGVQVNADAELAPRQQITHVPLAVRADEAVALTQPMAPAGIAPQGAGSGLDADRVDGIDASGLLARSAHTGTQAPATISPQGSGSGLDADRLDGKDAAAFALNPHTHQCTKYMSLPGGQSAAGFCALRGEWCALTVTGNGNSLEGCGTTNPGFGDWGAICCR